MSINFSKMLAIQQEIAPLLEGSLFVKCFECGLRRFVFCFKKNNKEYQLLLCLQEPFLRFHLLSQFLSGKKSIFTERLQHELLNCLLKEISLVHNDRILRLQFHCHSHVKTIIAEFFSKKPNLYFLNEEGKIIYSLNPSFKEFYSYPDIKTPSTISESTSSEKLEKEYQERELEHQFLQKKKIVKDIFQQRLAKFQKAYEKHSEELEKCRKWELIQHEGLLLQSHLFQIKKGMSECSIPDWGKNGELTFLSLDPKLPPQAQVESRFRQAKKLKAGIKHHEKQLTVIVQQREQELQKLTLLEQIETIEALDIFVKTNRLVIVKEKVEKPKFLPYREFVTEAGVKIWVGKSAKDNEALTFHYGKGNDWWLHVSDYPGSHLIIKTSKNQSPDQESLQDAFQLALHYSKAKDQGGAEVCVTQCKYVSRIGKGQVGKVAISKHKHFHVEANPERLKRLKTHSTQKK